MSQRVTFPVTITGMNVTERNTKLPTGKGPFDKVGITIQQTNVIDEAGQNLVIPEGTWLNGLCPPGKMDELAAGSTVAISISAKAKGDGTFWYNFGYFPPQDTTQVPTAATVPGPAATPVPPAPGPDYVTRAELDDAVQKLEAQITAVANDIDF